MGPSSGEKVETSGCVEEGTSCRGASRWHARKGKKKLGDTTNHLLGYKPACRLCSCYHSCLGKIGWVSQQAYAQHCCRAEERERKQRVHRNLMSHQVDAPPIFLRERHSSVQFLMGRYGESTVGENSCSLCCHGHSWKQNYTMFGCQHESKMVQVLHHSVQ